MFLIRDYEPKSGFDRGAQQRRHEDVLQRGNKVHLGESVERCRIHRVTPWSNPTAQYSRITKIRDNTGSENGFIVYKYISCQSFQSKLITKENHRTYGFLFWLSGIQMTNSGEWKNGFQRSARETMFMDGHWWMVNMPTQRSFPSLLSIASGKQ